MALKIYERYEPLANPGTAEYPTGSIKNKSAPQNKDGTPIEQDWANDLLGMRDAILAAGNVQADGNVENAVNSQIVEALKAFLVESERVVQSPGSSEDDVMSQKAVTDTFAQLAGGSKADFTDMPEVGGEPLSNLFVPQMTEHVLNVVNAKDPVDTSGWTNSVGTLLAGKGNDFAVWNSAFYSRDEDTEAYQDIELNQSQIDSLSRSSYRVAELVWGQASHEGEDEGTMKITSYSNGSEVDSFELPLWSVPEDASSNVKSPVYRRASLNLDPSTDTIRLTIKLRRHQGIDNNAYINDIRLSLFTAASVPNASLNELHTQQMPLVSGSPIVSSGETNAGSWVQYADGTMIQWLADTCVYAANTFLEIGITYPKAFMSGEWPAISLTPRYESNATAGMFVDQRGPMVYNSDTNTGCTVRQYSARGSGAQFSEGNEVRFFLTVTGRWKQ